MAEAGVDKPPAVWWHTMRGPMVGLVPARRLDSHTTKINHWYVAVLAPIRPEPDQASPDHWRLARFLRRRNYDSALATFNRVMTSNGGPARRASPVALPDRSTHRWTLVFLSFWRAIVRFFRTR